MSDNDPYLKPAFSLRNRTARLLWNIVYVILFRTSPRPLFKWRSWLLILFGAELGENCHIYPRAQIWAPWNLKCGDVVAIADEAIIYNPSRISIGSHSTISQQAFLCAATHDYQDSDFPLVSSPIFIGERAWICARASVQPGVQVGEGAVLGLGSVATKHLDAWAVYAGVPAKRIKIRVLKS